MVSPDLDAFHFLRPWWLLALVAALAIALLVSRAQRLHSRWETLIDPELRDVLIERTVRRRGPWVPIVTGLALALGSLALAGPTWQRLPQPLAQRTDALVIVLDLSLSMYARDVPPSRLVQARHAVTDVLRTRREGFTGLIAYAGDAHTVAPLTDDVSTIENLLTALAPDMMPMLGSNPGAALELARTLFKNAGITQGRILLVTDGIDQISDIAALATPNFPISILGIGSGDGAPIPLDFVDQPGRFLTDRQGNTIVAKLDAERLATLAQMCYGRYVTATADVTMFKTLLATQLPSANDERQLERKFDLWADYGYWLILPLVPLALLAFRRGAVVLVLCALLPPPAHASWWDDLWQRPDQQAMQALQSGEPERAASLFEDPQWQGVARYRGADYAGADERFAQDPSPVGNYNRGNALAEQGRFPEAIAAYDATLHATPSDADAAFNKALLEKLLKQQQESGDNKKGQESQQNRDESKSDHSREEQSAANPKTNESQSQSADAAQRKPTDSEKRPAEEKKQQSGEDDKEEQTAQRDEPRDEKRDALEQWLRRVPDDPAGLLRRKFLYETNQRQRLGHPDRRDQERIW
jgi:Ca-activated chloride channel family protein